MFEALTIPRETSCSQVSTNEVSFTVSRAITLPLEQHVQASIAEAAAFLCDRPHALALSRRRSGASRAGFDVGTIALDVDGLTIRAGCGADLTPKLYFHVKAEDETVPPIRLKVEINTRERTAHGP